MTSHWTVRWVLYVVLIPIYAKFLIFLQNHLLYKIACWAFMNASVNHSRVLRWVRKKQSTIRAGRTHNSIGQKFTTLNRKHWTRAQLVQEKEGWSRMRREFCLLCNSTGHVYRGIKGTAQWYLIKLAMLKWEGQLKSSRCLVILYKKMAPEVMKGDPILEERFPCSC